MTNMNPPQEGRNTSAPSLRGLKGRSATELNGQAAKRRGVSGVAGGWMPENISGVPAGRSVFHLTSPFIGPFPGFFLVRTVKRRINLARVERLRVTLQMASFGGEMGSGLAWNTPSCTSDSNRLPRKDATFSQRNVACARFRHFYGYPIVEDRRRRVRTSCISSNRAR
jgi:hypothetical protein